MALFFKCKHKYPQQQRNFAWNAKLQRRVVNHVLLMAKQYLYSCRCRKTFPIFKVFTVLCKRNANEMRQNSPFVHANLCRKINELSREILLDPSRKISELR